MRLPRRTTFFLRCRLPLPLTRARRVLSLLLLPLLLATACSHTPIVGSANRSVGLPPRAEAIHADTQAARALLSASLDWRERAVRFASDIEPRLASRSPLTASELNALHRGGEDYVFITRRWQALVDSQGPEAWMRDATTLAFNPLARTQAKFVLAATLVQFDDYQTGVAPYIHRPKLRRLLKADNPAVFGELDAAIARSIHPARRQRLARAVAWHQDQARAAADDPAGAREYSADEIFLDEIITQSPGYHFFAAQRLVTRALSGSITGIHMVASSVTDSASLLSNTATHHGSRAVGNTLGLVATRRGWLDSMPAGERAELAGSLRPLDLLLEKTPFRLTDASVPGHYGHVAIWSGTEADLRTLGVWDDPLVRPHHQRIRANTRIIEALRSGVQLSTLDAFLNIDDLLVIRPAPMSDEETRAAVLRAFAQIGKKYDFNFDVESDRRIVCSELAYVVFPAVDWPTKPVLGRHSISPDQVAMRALFGGPFIPQILYHDGVRIHHHLTQSLDCLLRDDTSAFLALHPGFEGRSAR